GRPVPPAPRHLSFPAFQLLRATGTAARTSPRPILAFQVWSSSGLQPGPRINPRTAPRDYAGGSFVQRTRLSGRDCLAVCYPSNATAARVIPGMWLALRSFRGDILT